MSEIQSKHVKLTELRAAWELMSVSIEVEKIRNLFGALRRSGLCRDDGRVYVWQILARPSQMIRRQYGIGIKSFQALDEMLRSAVGDDLVDEWLKI